MHKLTNDHSLLEGLSINKEQSYSLSTEGSPRSSELPVRTHKEKSQLCKRFIEHGSCPYQNKCKFAHGLTELKMNHHQNSKYKTKYCGGFIQQGFCPFGNRCNFIHSTNSYKNRTISQPLDLEFLLIRSSGVKQSKLLKLLE